MIKCIHCGKRQTPCSEEYGSSMQYKLEGKTIKVFNCKWCHKPLAYNGETVREPTEQELKWGTKATIAVVEAMMVKGANVGIEG